MKVSNFVLILFAILLYGFCISFFALADQIIYVEMSDFIPAMSQFNVEVKGNKWVETQEEGAIEGTAFGAPGDNNSNADGGDPYLVIKLPVSVRAGESTTDGKKWDGWARLFEPEMLVTGNNYNSFFLRTSTDAKNWTPQKRGDTSLVWNDAGFGNLLFPACVDGVDVVFTDIGDKLPWFWERHSGGGKRSPDSTIDPVLKAGTNYIEIGIRESDPVKFPRIDVICFRNDKGKPSDAEAMLYLNLIAVQPAGRLIDIWGSIKSE